MPGWTRPGTPSAHTRLPAAYVNFLDLDDSHRADEAFGAEKYRRILDLKAIYDPAVVFRSNPVTPVLSLSAYSANWKDDNKGSRK